MSTKNDRDFDEELFLSPEPGKLKVRGGWQEREERRRAADKERITIRLNRELVEQFKALSGERGYQSLINQALQEWLAAQGIKELVRDEFSSLASRFEHLLLSKAKEGTEKEETGV